MDKLNGFRITSMLTITILWIILSITFGILWDRLKPDETTQFKNCINHFLYFLLKNYKIS